jgi:hypothetical protein
MFLLVAALQPSALICGKSSLSPRLRASAVQIESRGGKSPRHNLSS